MNFFKNNNSTMEDSLDKPLLLDLEDTEDNNPSKQLAPPRIPAVTKEFALYSMLLGCCVGSLLHLATLGGSFVMLANIGLNPSSSRAKVVAFAMSLVISLLAVTLNSAVRYLLGVALRRVSVETTTTPSENDLAYVRLCNLLGLVTGIFLASGATELLIEGNGNHVCLHGLTLVVWVGTALVISERKYADLDSYDDDCGDTTTAYDDGPSLLA
jgi:hypothetical protein